MSNVGEGPSGPRKKTILSLDGGGIRGYSSLLILEKLMGEIQKMLGSSSPPRPCEYFDIIGGTSTGGIIAILLGRLQMSAEEALAAFNRVGSLAFTPKMPFRFPTQPKYSESKLEEAVKSELRRADSADHNEDALFAVPGATKTIVLAVTKINVGAKPTMFRTYNVEPVWEACTIWEVARATSAATTFFPPIHCGRDNIAMLDVGFGLNNPAEVLIAEADTAIPDRETSCIVSIGTGLRGAIDVDSNPMTLLRALVSMATNSQAVHARLEERFGNENTLKYWRFDEDVALGDIKMDDWKKLELGTISGHTRNYLNEYAVAKAIRECAGALMEAKSTARIGGLPVLESEETGP